MPRFTGVALLAVLLLAARPPLVRPSLHALLQRDLQAYLQARARVEHISGIALSVSLRGLADNIDVTAGTTQYSAAGSPLTGETLWQIGSNTKAFTAATVLQLEAEGKLTIDQTLAQWLPQYPAWKRVTIRRLLNMTSGIPGYDNAPAMLRAYTRDPQRHFTLAELIAYAYPTTPGAPPPTTGYAYSNTNYLLAEKIIERATGHTYADELGRRFFRSSTLGLDDTYYEPYDYPKSIRDRMTSGYYFSHDVDNAPLLPLLGADVKDFSVSWMQGAGGIVSDPEDLTRWARALYSGSILPAKQRAEMLSLVSLKNGRPIPATTLDDPRGFGLGVAQLTTAETGTVWYYEGITLGYRMVHVYFPRQDAVIAFGLNSQCDSKEDRAGKLAVAIYNTLHAAGKL
ncbi:MAG: beta-lactamase family protein [Candidatus Eremiobacteraeota bacterium]|nr:beta-lactamase family protein [Candidatus Eremiobacteraeota bacterium]MBV9263913.1 beta-lactamase family protein [Candidatus Eremiobacteraeota bacterium]